MLAASLLFKKIYSNAKVSSSNELMLLLSALPSPVSRDLFFGAVSGQCRFVMLWGTGSPQGTAWPTHCMAEDLWWWDSSRSAYWRAWFTGKLGGCAAQLPADIGCGTACVSRCAWDGQGPWLYLLRCKLSPSFLVVPLAPSGTCSAACWSPVIITRGTEQHWRGSVLIPRRKAYAHLKERK